VVVERFAEAGQVAYARIKLNGEEADPGFDLKREIFIARLVVAPGIERAPSLERLWDYLRYQLQDTNPIEAV
jgi:hypothetical protein